MNTPIRKALTFRASSIGDSLMGKYLLENIHAQFPDAKLGIVVASRGAMIRDLLAGTPYIEVIEANRRNLKSVWTLFLNWKGSDLVVTQYAGKHGGQFGLSSKLVARLLARRGGLIGFSDSFKWNTLLYDQLLPVRPDKAVVEHEREALRSSGLKISLPYPTFSPKEHVKNHQNLVASSYAVLHTFAGNGKGRSMSPVRARELLEALHTAEPRMQFIITASAAEKSEAEVIAEGFPAKVISGASLQEVARILADAAVVVSVDTGVAHMTAQMHVPLIVLATCLGPNWWFPEQYGPEAPVMFFNKAECCTAGHKYADYPPCLNEVNMTTIVNMATAMMRI